MGILEIAAMIASAGYTAWKLYSVIANVLATKKVAKWQLVARIVSAAVNGVYEDFVREEKANAEDGKLTPQAKAKARDMAYDRVIQGLKDHNMDVNVLKPLEIIDLIEQSVTEKKNEAAIGMPL